MTKARIAILIRYIALGLSTLVIGHTIGEATGLRRGCAFGINDLAKMIGLGVDQSQVAKYCKDNAK